MGPKGLKRISLEDLSEEKLDRLLNAEINRIEVTMVGDQVVIKTLIVISKRKAAAILLAIVAALGGGGWIVHISR